MFDLAGDGSTSSLARDGRLAYALLERDHAFARLRWEVLQAVRAGSPMAVLLHAAAVARGGDVLLIPGRSGAGKSFLTAHLADEGWCVLSDELVAIDIATANVSGAAVPLNLKPSAGPGWQELQDGVAPVTTPRDALGGRPARVRWIVSPAHRSGAEPELRAICPRDALLVLLSVMVSQRPGGLARLGSIAAAAPAWMLTSSTAGDAMQAVRDACSQPALTR